MGTYQNIEQADAQEIQTDDFWKTVHSIARRTRQWMNFFIEFAQINKYPEDFKYVNELVRL